MTEIMLSIPMHRKVHRCLASFGRYGATAYEIAKTMGNSMHESEAAKNLTELQRLGYVLCNGVTSDYKRGAFVGDGGAKAVFVARERS